jgi:hypothetical protein
MATRFRFVTSAVLVPWAKRTWGATSKTVFCDRLTDS